MSVLPTIESIRIATAAADASSSPKIKAMHLSVARAYMTRLQEELALCEISLSAAEKVHSEYTRGGTYWGES